MNGWLRISDAYGIIWWYVGEGTPSGCIPLACSWTEGARTLIPPVIERRRFHRLIRLFNIEKRKAKAYKDSE